MFLIPMEERVALATGETVVFLEGNCGPDFPGKKVFEQFALFLE